MVQNTKTAVQRFVGGLSVILAISILLFFASELIGDPLYALLPIEATEAQREALRVELGLNQPAWIRLGHYLLLTLKGEFGHSYKLQEPVIHVVMPYLWGTVKLIGLALPLGLVLGIVLGLGSLFLPQRPNRWMGRILLVLHSLPGFIPAILAVELFAVKFKWVSPSGSEPEAMILPVLLLGGAEAVKLGILLRAKLQEVRREKFVLTARAKGVAPGRFYLQYMLRPALSLIFSFTSIQVGVLLSSAVVIETVFAYPGVGSLAIQAVSNRDLPLLQGCIVVTTLLFLVTRFAVDLAQPLLDPRVKQTLPWERSLW